MVDQQVELLLKPCQHAYFTALTRRQTLQSVLDSEYLAYNKYNLLLPLGRCFLPGYNRLG